MSFRIVEPPGPSEWLINISLPSYARFLFEDWNGYPEDDLVVVRKDTPGWEVYDQVIARASETIGCPESELLVLYDKQRSFSWIDRPLEDLGFYNCCTVSVEKRDSWIIHLVAFRSATGNPLCDHSLCVDPLDDCNEVNARILDIASNVLKCSMDDLYVLYNGTPLRRSNSVELCKLGIHNNSTLSVFHRLRGGVCIAQNATGRKRSVSS